MKITSTLLHVDEDMVLDALKKSSVSGWPGDETELLDVFNCLAEIALRGENQGRSAQLAESGRRHA